MMKSKASTPQYRDGWDRTFRARPSGKEGELVKSVEGEDGYEMRSSPCAGVPVERDGKTVHSVTGRPWKGPIE